MIFSQDNKEVYLMKKRIGIIGFGGICNGAHLSGYNKCTDIAEITAVCDNDPEKLKEAKAILNLPDECLFENYNDLINSGLVDAVDICTPNYVHCEMAQAAVKAGLDYSIEKPIGINYAETKKLYDMTMNSSSRSFVCFSLRYDESFRYMRDIVKSGKIGKLRHIYITYLKDSGLIEGRRLEWRFEKEKAGSGVLGDLGVHLIDAVRFFGEEFDGVFAQMGVTVKERQTLDGTEVKPVTTDDWCNMNAVTKNGVCVTMRISRVATNTKDSIAIEVIGEEGKMAYELKSNDGGEVYANDGLRISIGKDAPMVGAQIPEDYKAIQSREFINMLNGEKSEFVANIGEGIECQKILEAAITSAQTGRYIKMSEID